MLSIDSSAAMARALDRPIDPHLRALLALRLSQIDAPELGDVARFAVVEPGDGASDVEAELGSPLTCGGEPCHDWLLLHPGGIYEVAFDFGEIVHVVVVQDRPGVDPALLAFCRTHALPAADSGDEAGADRKGDTTAS